LNQDFEISTIVVLDAKIIRFRDALSFRFLGIRYATQPERFKYSTVYKGSGGNVSATQYGSECVQSPDKGSEDCLFLNIWTPYIPRSPRDALAKDLKPVMFFIHGGGYATSTGSDPTYDGGTIVSRGDVVVSLSTTG
jgi:carboxylesterase type B